MADMTQTAAIMHATRNIKRFDNSGVYTVIDHQDGDPVVLGYGLNRQQSGRVLTAARLIYALALLGYDGEVISEEMQYMRGTFIERLKDCIILLGGDA